MTSKRKPRTMAYRMREIADGLERAGLHRYSAVVRVCAKEFAEMHWRVSMLETRIRKVEARK